MANLNAAIRQVLRTRQELDVPGSGQFDRYKAEYEAILESTADLAGDPAFDELKQWMINTTEERNRLPTPKEVRRRALTVCESNGVNVPQHSPLYD